MPDSARSRPADDRRPCRAWARGIGLAAATLGVLLAGGCRTPAPPPADAYLFYPQPPVTPRFQFLTSIASPADVVPRPSLLNRFLFGVAPAPPPIGKPYGLALKHGKLYISDTIYGTIHIADLRQHTWDYFQPTGPGRLRKNIGVAVDEDGTLFVSDTVRGQVLVYDASGAYRDAIGEPGALKPVAMELTAHRLYVTDMKSRKVRVYDKTTRAYLGGIPRSTVTNEAEVLYQPIGLAIDTDGSVFVSDAGAFRIQVYWPDGRYRRTIGQHGDTPGSFVRNKGLALDREHRLYAIDAGFQIAQLYDAQDRMLMFFGEPDAGEAGRMQLPADVLVDYDHVDDFRRFVAPGHTIEFLVLVSNQFGDGKIHVYGFLGGAKSAAGPGVGPARPAPP